jgi:nucleotide-binding universal stress UspA family protein
MSQISAGPGVQGELLRADAEELISARAPEGELLKRDTALLNQRGIQPHTKVRHGLVVDEILAEANGQDYDLVVIGMHAAKGWSRYLLEDITTKVVEGIGRPVLVMR